MRVHTFVSYVLNLLVLDFVKIYDSQLDRDGYFLILGNSHLGDAYSFCSLMSHFAAEKEKEVKIIFKEQHSFLLLFFPNLIGYEEKLDIASDFTGHVRVILYEKDHIMHSIFWNFSYIFRLLTFMIFFPYLENSSRRLNTLSKTISYLFYHNVMPLNKSKLTFGSPIFNDTNYKEEIKEIMRKFELVPGRTVLIAPESNSGHPLTKMELITIIQTVSGLGLNYIINTDSSNLGLKNCIKLPLGTINGVLNELGYFISIRSGLCDLISTSKAKSIIIYRSEHLGYYDLDMNRFSVKPVQIIREKEDSVQQFKDQLYDALYDRL